MTNNPIETPVEDLNNHGHDACNPDIEYSNCAIERGKAFACGNPAKVALGVFALGFLIAFLIPRPKRSYRDRYLEDPLEELKELLRSTSLRVGQTTQETCGNTSSAIGGILKSLKRSLACHKV